MRRRWACLLRCTAACARSGSPMFGRWVPRTLVCRRYWRVSPAAAQACGRWSRRWASLRCCSRSACGTRTSGVGGDLVTGLVLGALVPAGWLVTGWLGADPFEPVPVESLTFVAPVAGSLHYLMTGAGERPDFGIAAGHRHRARGAGDGAVARPVPPRGVRGAGRHGAPPGRRRLDGLRRQPGARAARSVRDLPACRP